MFTAEEKACPDFFSLWPDVSQGAFPVKAWLEKQLPSQRPGRKASWLRVYLFCSGNSWYSGCQGALEGEAMGAVATER